MQAAGAPTSPAAERQVVRRCAQSQSAQLLEHAVPAHRVVRVSIITALLLHSPHIGAHPRYQPGDWTFGFTVIGFPRLGWTFGYQVSSKWSLELSMGGILNIGVASASGRYTNDTRYPTDSLRTGVTWSAQFLEATKQRPAEIFGWAFLADAGWQREYMWGSRPWWFSTGVGVALVDGTRSHVEAESLLTATPAKWRYPVPAIDFGIRELFR